MKALEVTKIVTWVLRILISGLFFLSVFAKFYPSPSIGVIKFFENGQLIDVLGFSKSIAPFLSRLIIAFELFLAIAILLPYFLKRIIIPISILLLIGFSIHLSILIVQGSDGNCGCFGELIPMTPIQALIKNIFTIGLLFFLFRTIKTRDSSNKFVLALIFVSTTIFMFTFVPLDSRNEKVLEKKVSSFSKYVAGIDENEKLLCFFVPGCDHCQAAAKEITQLSHSIKNFPEVKIVFMDEETDKIPAFFEFAGATYDYDIMDIRTFIDAFWKDTFETPGVIYLNNGNIIQSYQGTEDSGSKSIFNSNNLKSILDAR